MTNDLAAWLLDQITEDAKTARWVIENEHANSSAEWTEPSSGVIDTGDDLIPTGDSAIARHIIRWDPKRVLAECEAKQQIVELCKQPLIDVSPAHAPNSEFLPGAAEPWAEPVLRQYGAMYAKLGRPGYREEWKP